MPLPPGSIPAEARMIRAVSESFQSYFCEWPIVVIDDEPDALLLAKLRLADRHPLHLCCSAEEALKLLADGLDPYAIISDQMMPGLRGTDFFTQTIETHPNTTRVLFTAYARDEQVIDAAINIVHVDYLLQKPVSAERMEEIAACAVAVSHIRRESVRELEKLRELARLAVRASYAQNQTEADDRSGSAQRTDRAAGSGPVFPQ
jgi:DNA-binding NtrC family response regulator